MTWTAETRLPGARHRAARRTTRDASCGATPLAVDPVFPTADARARLDARMSERGYRCSPIAICTNAGHPDEPLGRARSESEHAWTRALLELLARSRHPVVVITDSPAIERDMDLLAELAHERLIAVHVRLATLDAALARAWEPHGSAPWRRLESIRRLSEAAIPVGVLASPLAPLVNDHELERVLEAAWQSGARAAHYETVAPQWKARQPFHEWLNEHFPDRAEQVLARLAERTGSPKADAPARIIRLKGWHAWTELIRVRFDVAAHRLGFDRARLDFELRTDLFRPPHHDAQLGLF